jgi:hypothetical protein
MRSGAPATTAAPSASTGRGRGKIQSTSLKSSEIPPIPALMTSGMPSPLRSATATETEAAPVVNI